MNPNCIFATGNKSYLKGYKLCNDIHMPFRKRQTHRSQKPMKDYKRFGQHQGLTETGRGNLMRGRANLSDLAVVTAWVYVFFPSVICKSQWPLMYANKNKSTKIFQIPEWNADCDKWLSWYYKIFEIISQKSISGKNYVTFRTPWNEVFTKNCEANKTGTASLATKCLSHRILC